MDEMSHEADKNLHNKIVSALTEGRDIKCSSYADKLGKNFYVEEILALIDIKVTVNGVGELSFPLSKATAQELINVSTNEKFGMGGKTVLDNNVCNTQIIDSKNLVVTINPEAVSRITNNIKKAFDFPTGSTLMPHLHNMLIYGPGQFFNKHRDSEKLQNMVATLVIILPSPHIGGDLVVEHDNKKYVFSSQNVHAKIANAKCICFYSDCWHKVNIIKTGYRVALTFNVVLETGELSDAVPCTNKELKVAVQDYFNTETLKDKPKKIIFLLNHTYTEHNLLWNLLKGEDRQYASSLRSVAQELNLNIYLVFANIDQNWSSASKYEAVPDFLISTNILLDYWIDLNNVKLPYAEYSITESEISFTLDTDYKNFDPYAEEFEPMDNEETSVIYWYRRAAVALWQKSDSLMINFELNYDAAMIEIRFLIGVPGNEKKVTEILDTAVKLTHMDRPTTKDFKTLVDAAIYINAKREALAVLSQFHLNVLIPENVQFLARLQQQYGIDWLTKLVDALRQMRTYADYCLDTMISEAINPFVHKFLNSECDRSVIEFLLNAEVITFIKKHSKYNDSYYNVHKAEVLDTLQQLFKACAAIGNVALQEKLAEYMTSQPKAFRKKELVRLYLELQKTLSPESSELLRIHLREDVEQELLTQIRDDDDWSISLILPCCCEHCNVLTNFLRSRTVRTTSLPANEIIRKHIVDILNCAELFNYVKVKVDLDSDINLFRLTVLKSVNLRMEAALQYTELKALLHCLEPNPAAKKRKSDEAR